MTKRPTERFSDRVDNYVRYRPSYPEAVVDTLIECCSLCSTSTIADIGSGTGIFTRQLLDKHLRVVAVEPNADMRQAAEAMLPDCERFTSIDGSAEASGLDDDSVDLIVAAQAFHWFRRDEAHQEFERILRFSGWLALVWNQRKMQQPFQKAYDALLRKHAPEYSAVNHMNISEDAIASFFDPQSYRVLVYDNRQIFDLQSFLGRMSSSSYTPAVGTSDYLRLAAEAEALFSTYSEDGVVAYDYDTRLHLGKLSPAWCDSDACDSRSISE